MTQISLGPAIFCILIGTSCFASASLLSWLTGSGANRPTVPDGVLGTDSYVGGSGAIPNQYQEESGECSHWGNTISTPYTVRDPIFEINKGLAAPGELIGSHKHVPVGTVVAITNIKNGNTVSVRVVPPKSIPIAGRVMELSPAAFSQVANLREGVFICSVRVIQAPRPGGMHSLSSYTVDNSAIRMKPTSYDPSESTQLGTASSVPGSSLGSSLGTSQNGFVNGIGQSSSIPPFQPVRIGSGYTENGNRERHYGSSIVTAWDPQGQYE